MNAATLLPLPDLSFLAENLARRHCPGGRVDPEMIARAEGLLVLYLAFREEIDGLLLHEHGREIILCNSRRAPRGSERCRFTIAHELGHYFSRKFFGRPSLPVARTPGAFRSEERPADRFAAHLLMPRDAFLAEFESLTVSGLMGISVLSAVFGTSLAATAYRALELDCFTAPSAIILWDNLGQRCGRRVSSITRDVFPECLTLVEHAPEGSVTKAAVNSLARGLRLGSALPEDWFPAWEGNGWGGGALLSEEVLSRGSHGWMTLLQANEIGSLS